MRLTSRHSPLDQTKGTEFIFALDRPSQPVVNCSNTCSMARSGAATMSDELNLAITGVEPQNEIAGARRVWLATTRGKIAMILHTVERAERAMLCVGAAGGSLDGPAMLYPRLGLEMRALGLTVLRLGYRIPGEMTKSLTRYDGGIILSQGSRPSAGGPGRPFFRRRRGIAAATLNPLAVAVGRDLQPATAPKRSINSHRVPCS